jgi:hypothetical protein
MNIEEIKEEHKKFEKELCKLVNEFVKNTGCLIHVTVGITNSQLDGRGVKKQYINTYIDNPF